MLFNPTALGLVSIQWTASLLPYRSPPPYGAAPYTCRTGLLDDAYQLNRLDLVGPSVFLNLTTALAARLRVRRGGGPKH